MSPGTQPARPAVSAQREFRGNCSLQVWNSRPGLFFFFFFEYLLSFLTCSLSPSAGNYSVSLSPDSQQLHYIIQTVLFEFWSENHTPLPPSISPPPLPRLGGRGTQNNKQWKLIFLETSVEGLSLAVQWLRLRLPMQGAWVRSLVGELISHMPGSQKTKKTP